MKLSVQQTLACTRTASLDDHPQPADPNDQQRRSGARGPRHAWPMKSLDVTLSSFAPDSMSSQAPRPPGSKSCSCREGELDKSWTTLFRSSIRSVVFVFSLTLSLFLTGLFWDELARSSLLLNFPRPDSHWLLHSHTVSRVVILGRHFCCK